MGLLNALVGGKSSQTTTNAAYDFLKGAFGPTTGLTGQAGGLISRFLGGDASGFNAFKDAAGFDFAAEQGSRGITGNAAARGLLRSGSTGKALVDYGQQLGNQYAGNYLQQLLGLGNMGLNSGQLLASAAPQTTTGKQGGGLGKLLGGALGMIGLSDPRLKTDVEKVGDLGIYEWRYKWDPPGKRHRGVMADEVAERYPEAMGPKVGGFLSVDYGKLMEDA